MRKITAGLFASLDGVVEAPDEWHFPYFNDEMGAAVDATRRRRRQCSSVARPTTASPAPGPTGRSVGEEDAPFAKKLGDVRKIVVSNQKLEFTGGTPNSSRAT